jgi:4-diphosphocytidyl-2-C-methyl-D-erythritol kinase
MGRLFYSRARAKLNLSLHVKALRDDGFHDIKSVFEQVAWGDELWVALGDGRTSIEVNPKWLGLEKDNLVIKALEAFGKSLELTLNARVWLIKRIPVASGLGGGSSDAACMLKILNHALGNPLKIQDLMDIASSLGSDVPFFLDPGCRWVYGKGEKLGRGYPLRKAVYVILIPDAKIPTQKAYRDWDDSKGRVSFDNKESEGCANDFLPIVSARVPDVSVCKRYLEEYGSLKANLSGSGPSVFGLFLDEGAAKRAFWRARNGGVEGLSKPLKEIVLTHSARNPYPAVSCL